MCAAEPHTCKLRPPSEFSERPILLYEELPWQSLGRKPQGSTTSVKFSVGPCTTGPTRPSAPPSGRFSWALTWPAWPPRQPASARIKWRISWGSRSPRIRSSHIASPSRSWLQVLFLPILGAIADYSHLRKQMMQIVRHARRHCHHPDVLRHRCRSGGWAASCSSLPT